MPRNVIQGIDMTENGTIKLTLKLDASCFDNGIKEVLGATIAAYKWAVEGNNAKDLDTAAKSVAQTTDKIMNDMLSGGLKLYQKWDTYDEDPGTRLDLGPDELTAAAQDQDYA